MERGEIAVLAIQFGVLIIVVLLLSNLAGPDTQSTPQINTVYWGAPGTAGSTTIKVETTNVETLNASSVVVYYSLAYSTHVVSLSASRLCLTPGTNSSGEEQDFPKIPINYDSAKKSYYFTFGPTQQITGWSCEYTITLTDSLQQTTTWITAVEVLSTNATSG